MKKSGFFAATASVAAASASAISPSSNLCTNSKLPRDENKNRACSDKFAPRFDGLRFIETLVTAHR